MQVFEVGYVEWGLQSSLAQGTLVQEVVISDRVTSNTFFFFLVFKVWHHYEALIFREKMEETNFPLLILFITFKSEKNLFTCLDKFTSLEFCITVIYLRLNNITLFLDSSAWTTFPNFSKPTSAPFECKIGGGKGLTAF